MTALSPHIASTLPSWDKNSIISYGQLFAESVKYICPAPRQAERAYDPIQRHLRWSDHSIFPRMVLGIWYGSLVYHSTHTTPYQDVVLQ